MVRLLITICFSLWIIALPRGLMGQTLPEGASEDDLERLSERATSETAVSDALEEMIDLSAHPIDLNNATKAELQMIPFLTAKMCGNLEEYRQTYGEILSPFEMQIIPGFDSILIKKIMPYFILLPVSALPPPSPRNLINLGHHDLLLRFEQVLPISQGYNTSDSILSLKPNAGYKGTPHRYYFRYNYNWFDKIRIGFSGEKDPGEQFFRGAQSWGMDYYAGFLSIGSLGILKNLTIGNFKASFGQGLTFGSGLSTASMPGFSVSGYQTTSFLRPSGGIRPSLSVSEGDYLRGAALTIKTGRLEIAGFASWHYRDAKIASADTLGVQKFEFSSLISTGYHRTAEELANRNAISELIAGGNVNIPFSKGINFGMKIGFTGVYSQWSARFSQEQKIYNRYSLQGTFNYVIGADWLIRYKTLFLSGEVSRSASGGMALISMASFTPDPGVGLTLIYRNYDPHYQNLLGNAFGQNSNNCNEQGIYIAGNFALLRNIQLSLFCDFYSFPWLKYRVDRPARGYEAGIMTGWQASRNVNVNFRFYQKFGMINGLSENPYLHCLAEFNLRSYRITLNWNPSSFVTLKTRMEARETSSETNPVYFGYLVCQDLQVKFSRVPLTGTFRYALFDIPGYDQRIYIYEPEVLFGYSMPAYSGKGIRGCLVIRCKVTPFCEIWARGGVTYYSDRNEMGNGLDMRSGNTVTEITAQVMFRL